MLGLCETSMEQEHLTWNGGDRYGAKMTLGFESYFECKKQIQIWFHWSKHSFLRVVPDTTNESRTCNDQVVSIVIIQPEDRGFTSSHHRWTSPLSPLLVTASSLKMARKVVSLMRLINSKIWQNTIFSNCVNPENMNQFLSPLYAQQLTKSFSIRPWRTL